MTLSKSDQEFIRLARLAVREGLTESGVERLLEIIDKLTVGDGWDEDAHAKSDGA